MKVLTVKQPWAWAIIHAGKNIENRGWRTRYRGPLAIHAGARMHTYTEMPHRAPPVPDDLVFSAIIGMVDLVDVVEASRSKWFEGEFGWVLRNPRPLRRPIPCGGRLGLWTLPPAQERQLAQALGRA